MSTLIHISWVCISIIHSTTLLSSINTIDDWNVYDTNTGNGWINGDIILNSNNILNKKYHGLFGGNSNSNITNTTVSTTSTLSRNDIQLSTPGTLTLTFTLIFGCDILNLTDTISVTIGDIEKQYYWVDAYDYGYATNNYPFKAQTFTISVFNTDSILYEQCDEVPGDSTVWAIDGSITSNTYEADTAIPISFISKFDYTSPFQNDNKYWAVTDIEFTMNTVTIAPKDSTDENKQIFGMDTTTFIAIIVVGVFVCIVIIILIIYCKKKKNVSSDDEVEMTDNGMQMNWKYTVKGQKVTDNTQLKSVFDSPLSDKGNQTLNYGNQQQSHIVPVAGGGENVKVNASYFSNNNYAANKSQERTHMTVNNNNQTEAPPSLPTIMGKRMQSHKNDDSSDDDSIFKMQNKYAQED
eukprot:237279_1